MIYIQIILAWLAIITLVVFMFFSCFKCNKWLENIIKERGNSDELRGGTLLILAIAFLLAHFVAFGIPIVYIWKTFINNKEPQKPKATIEQRIKTTNTETLSKEEQIVKNTLQEN